MGVWRSWFALELAEVPWSLRKGFALELAKGVVWSGLRLGVERG